MKLGAYHFANKPFNLDEVAATVERALETTRLRREVRQFRTNAARPLQPAAARRRHRRPSRRLRHLVARVAVSPASTVLLTGESGTGKDLVAKIIHYASDRASRPFMNITCSALPEQLLESELFGHERGAFTDARLQKKGLLETADGGTVFLDEIGEMTPALQAKLLRFLEEKSFKRVGGAQRHPGRRARDRRHQPQSRGGGRQASVPLRSLLPPERAADRDAAAAGARRGHPAAGRVLHRRLQHRVPEERARARRRRPTRCSSATAGPATCASCATSSSARCCCPMHDRLDARDFAGAVRSRSAAGDEFELPANGRRPRAAGAQPGHSGAASGAAATRRGPARCSA